MINLTTITRRQVWTFIVAMAGAWAVLMPWVTMSTGSAGMQASVRVNGFQGFGLLAFLAFAISAVMSLPLFGSGYLSKVNNLAMILAGVTALLSIVVSFSKMLAAANGALVVTETGPGVWLGIGASVLLILLAKYPWAQPAGKKAAGSIRGNISIPIKKLKGQKVRNDKSKALQKIADIEKLAELKNNGSITAEEYEILKAGILL